jgi:hypothetical protein
VRLSDANWMQMEEYLRRDAGVAEVRALLKDGWAG